MRKILILGSGCGGTIVANMLRPHLPDSEWEITILDKDEIHHYQPGWLFIPFGIYGADDCQRPKRNFIPSNVNLVMDKIEKVVPGENKVMGTTAEYEYDWLVISTGCRIMPNEVDGMEDDWGNDVHTFYTLPDALNLRQKLKYWKGGKIVHNICEMPYKCPVAPIEFIFMMDAYCHELGIRDKVEIEMVTPLGGIFTKPMATKALSALADNKGIKLTTNFDIAQVNPREHSIESHKGDKVDYDLLVTIPPNFGAQFLEDSGLTDPMCFIDTDPYTLKAKSYDNIYVIGDATNVPTSKAGSVAHYEAETVVENLVREIEGQDALPTFDGHATCFIVSGKEKAVLIDFNYEVEPLPGMFPFPGLGPMTLLGESHFNYWGKMMFKWVYWNLMLKGKELPLEAQLTMAGKIRPALA